MPRILEEGVKNLLKITDPVSGDTIGLYYRIPTTEEKVVYFRSLWNRETKKLRENQGPTRLKGGENILEGFTEGSFKAKINGELKPISSDPGSSIYFPEWKGWVMKYAPDLVETLGMEIFEGVSILTEPSQEEPPEKK